MLADRAGLEHDAQSRTPRPPAQVDVLQVERLEQRVEPADPLQRLGLVAGGVGGHQRLRDLRAEDAGLVERQRAFGECVPQRLALQQLLHHEVGAVLYADVMYGGNVRVIQRRGV